MSELKTHFGKLRKVDIAGDLEKVAKCIIFSKGLTEELKRPEFIVSYREWLLENFHEHYIDIGDSWYKILEDTELSEGDNIFWSKENEDGTIDYVVQYYNGGCCLSEALEVALKGE